MQIRRERALRVHRSYTTKEFLHEFANENSNSSKLIVEVDQAKDYILDFHK
jgi:hypothetical protein